VLAGRGRRRYALLAGLAAAMLLFGAGNLFVWGFEVTGNDTVPDEVILRALEKEGVAVGCRGLAINQERLRNHVLLELKDVSWLAVNVKGCVAHVQVVERHRPPEIVPCGVPANVVAARDGLVTEVEALGGRAEVLPGTTVTRGQLLISGVGDNASSMWLMRGMGRVWARTWRELSVLVPLKAVSRGMAAGSSVRFALDLGKRRIKFYGKGSVTQANCDKITRYKAWTLPGGIRLPVTLVTERLIHRDVSERRRSEAEARREGEELLLDLLDRQLDEDADVTQTRFAAARQGDYLLVTLKAECLEQIGRTVPLDTQEAADQG
jgi:similar to stage IV sporulation protein